MLTVTEQCHHNTAVVQYEYSNKSKSVIPTPEWTLEVRHQNQGWQVFAAR